MPAREDRRCRSRIRRAASRGRGRRPDLAIGQVRLARPVRPDDRRPPRMPCHHPRMGRPQEFLRHRRGSARTTPRNRCRARTVHTVECRNRAGHRDSASVVTPDRRDGRCRLDATHPPQDRPSPEPMLGPRLVLAAAAAFGQAGALLLRHWWPLTASACPISRRARRAATAAVVADTLAGWRRRPPGLDPIRSAVARRIDDAAYGAGVWLRAVRGPICTGAASRRIERQASSPIAVVDVMQNTSW